MASINMTPMVPVLLAVFVVLMVSGPAVIAQSLQFPGCTMPAPGYVPPKPVILEVLGRGRVSVDGEIVDPTTMNLHVLAHARARSSREVYIVASADTPYADVYPLPRMLKPTGLIVSLALPEGVG
jgi:biopolymer transport protein ExbD